MEATAKRLLDWYDSHARVLPWRSPPGTSPPDPYRVWLSEVMLQQTTVAAVGPYYARFLERWPTVEALAAADDADVMAAWAGLGYYARARNLLACAREVARRGGVFPGTETELRSLPGLGVYTAAAVAAIAFGQRAVVVDANVERVVARLFAIAEPLPGARATIRQRVDRLTPEWRAGDFAQAMMDLGSGICTVRAPRCLLCPLRSACAGHRAGAEQFPRKAAKPPKPQRSGRAFWIEREGNVWLVRRGDTGMLGGMRALPDDGWTSRRDGNGGAPLHGDWGRLGTVRHSFTHFDLDLQLMLYSGCDWASLTQSDGKWWPIEALDSAGLPTLFAKAARLALADRN
ncbi:MAG: A/G-specific adenine glycosylase [Sphingomonadales bacterium]|nr:A/G-specific adenine glycosylase [Sphingomonadales bacterium]